MVVSGIAGLRYERMEYGCKRRRAAENEYEHQKRSPCSRLVTDDSLLGGGDGKLRHIPTTSVISILSGTAKS